MASPFQKAQRREKEDQVQKTEREFMHWLLAQQGHLVSFVDSRASRHMVSTKEAFSSLDMSKGPPIVLGDDSLTESLGEGRIDLDHG